jgi:GGDEF domain-containing protein
MAPASAADEANAKRMRVAQAAKLEDRPAFMAKSLPSNFEALIKAADQGVYTAKKNGRGCVAVAT